MTTIVAGNTLTNSYTVNTDTTGNLVLQTNGGTTAMTLTGNNAVYPGNISVAGLATFTNNISAPNTFGFKNRIINGAMVFDQRNAGASITPTTSNTYCVDRWANYISQSSKYSIQQNAGSVTPPVGFSNYLGVTSLSAYSVGASDYFLLIQNIEGYNIADLGWGTANAKTVTLSFQVYSSLTGTFGGALKGASGTVYSYPFTYSISSANTWTTISITILGPTSGTWTSNNTTGIQLSLGLGAGSSYAGTAGSWQSGSYYSATGAVSVVGTNGATFYITGVQLEVGTQATSFDYRPYTTELQLCQRYLPAYNGSGFQWIGYTYAGSSGLSYVPFPVATRVPPTGIVYASLSNYSAYNSGNAGAAPTALSLDQAGVLSGDLLYTYSGLNNGYPCRLIQNSGLLYFTGCEL